MVWSILYVNLGEKSKKYISFVETFILMVWFFLKIWHEECQDISTDPMIPNASSDSGLTDINVLKDPPAIFLYLPKCL